MLYKLRGVRTVKARAFSEFNHKFGIILSKKHEGDGRLWYPFMRQVSIIVCTGTRFFILRFTGIGLEVVCGMLVTMPEKIIFVLLFGQINTSLTRQQESHSLGN